MISQAQEQSKSITNNNHVIDNAIDAAMEKLQTAKQEVSTIRYAQESLENEKASLTSAVKALREEKTQMEIEIEIMKTELSGLGQQLRKTQNKVLTKAIANNDRFDLIENTPTHFSHKQDEEDSMSVITAVTASTISTTSKSSSSSRATKRRARKSYNSPKKWRRMIRTHRLQSIFFDNRA